MVRIVTLMVATLLSGCVSGAGSPIAVRESGSADIENSAPPGLLTNIGGAAPGERAGEGQVTDFDHESAPADAVDRQIVYTGRFGLAVKSVEEAQHGARRLAEELGGYFQSLRDTTITIRVPAARWDEALVRLAALGRILSRQIDALDVTEEVVDLRLRLRNATVLVKRLEELLARAETVEAALKVETELARARTDVERLEGRLNYLSDRIAFSTITIAFTPAASAPDRPQALPFPWLRRLGIGNLLGLPEGGR